MNTLVREWAAREQDVRLVDVNPYITGQNCFHNHPNHYTKPVYYALSQEVVKITNEALGGRVIKTSQLKKLRIYLKQLIKRSLRR